MSGDPTGSDAVLSSFASIFESELIEPTDMVEEQSEAESVSDDEPSDSLEVIRGPETAKYEYDEESNSYSFQSDGKTVKADIAKLIDNYQMGEKFTQKSMDLSNKDKARAKEHAEALSTVKSTADELAARSDMMLRLLEEEQKALDDKIDIIDPVEYIKREKAIKARRDQLIDAKKLADNARSSQYQKIANEQFKLLVEAEGWDTEEKIQQGVKEVDAYAKENGITPKDIEGVTNHKVFQALIKAAKYDALQSKVKDKVKEVKSAPKSVKSNKPTPKVKSIIDMSLSDALYG